MRKPLVLVLALVAPALSIAACSFDEGTKFGAPSGLKRDNLPLPPEAAAPGVDASCAMPAEGGSTCGVKWSTDIWPLMSGSGPWNCADANCHGGNANSPAINDSDQAYAALAGFNAIKVNNVAKPYILPCSNDPMASAFLCNLQGTCGIKMPLQNDMLGSKPATMDEIAKVQLWITQCGAPKN
jgi:hypothetical protein